MIYIQLTRILLGHARSQPIVYLVPLTRDTVRPQHRSPQLPSMRRRVTLILQKRVQHVPRARHILRMRCTQNVQQRRHPHFVRGQQRPHHLTQQHVTSVPRHARLHRHMHKGLDVQMRHRVLANLPRHLAREMARMPRPHERLRHTTRLVPRPRLHLPHERHTPHHLIVPSWPHTQHACRRRCTACRGHPHAPRPMTAHVAGPQHRRGEASVVLRAARPM